MSADAALTNHVERCIARDFELTSAEPDGDGDYVLASGGSLVWVRPLLDVDQPLVRVWSIAAVGVKKNAGVLREINDQNLGMNVTRCFLAHDSVMISAETEIESVVPGQIRRTVEHVGWQSRHVGELITAVYGGERPFTLEDDDEEEAP